MTLTFWHKQFRLVLCAPTLLIYRTMFDMFCMMCVCCVCNCRTYSLPLWRNPHTLGSRTSALCVLASIFVQHSFSFVYFIALAIPFYDLKTITRNETTTTMLRRDAPSRLLNVYSYTKTARAWKIYQVEKYIFFSFNKISVCETFGYTTILN